ncbi:ABC transporter ATP-binding protein [Nocardioides marmoribigeumensis]
MGAPRLGVVPSTPSSPASTSAVDIRGLVMRYGAKTAVDHLDLTVERGTITAVLGPNGAGKTTTLETCEGFRRPQEGTVRVLGLDPVADRQELLPRIGVMLQTGGAWTGVRAVEMLRHVASLHAHPLPVELLVERLGLDDCGRTAYRRLSGGQKQRLSLAMALVGRPELLFVDEPTAGMDPQARRDTWELLEEVRGDGVTTVLTTHYLDEAERLADQVHIIDRGRLIASGSPAELVRGAGERTLRLTAVAPLPADAEQTLGADLGSLGEVHLVDGHTLLVSGAVDAKALGVVATWCERRDVEPDALAMGQRTLEDVFLQLTGREFEE